MNLSTKLGLGFVITGFAAGVLISALRLQEVRAPIWAGLGLLCFVTVFVARYRERIKSDKPNSKR
jgi:hypothetical protein